MVAGLSAEAASAADWIWPLSGNETPDEVNSSFGPRVNYSAWDFHDGLDLPAPIGTPVFAARAGTVYRAGDADGVYTSRHVVLETTDPASGQAVYVVYLHLDRISAGVVVGATVQQGDVVAAVGNDNASYSHLHAELRLGSPVQSSAVHPLHYLPYTDIQNFSPPGEARFCRVGGQMAARLVFGAPDKNEGDLHRVEVDILSGSTVLVTRRIDLDDGSTILRGRSAGDDMMWVGDIALEGYQGSNMQVDGRTDLQYGVIVRALPAACDGLVARAIDVAGNESTSEIVPVPNQTAHDDRLDFEDGVIPPSGWSKTTSYGGIVSANTGSARTGSFGMLCQDTSASGYSHRAALHDNLPGDRFEWLVEGSFNPEALGLAANKNVYPLYFRSGSKLSVAARIRNEGGIFIAGIVAKKPGGSLGGKSSGEAIATGVWRHWCLRLRRVGTREATAILEIDGNEVCRYSWDGTAYEPTSVRVGIGYSSSTVTATMHADDIHLAESAERAGP